MFTCSWCLMWCNAKKGNGKSSLHTKCLTTQCLYPKVSGTTYIPAVTKVTTDPVIQLDFISFEDGEFYLATDVYTQHFKTGWINWTMVGMQWIELMVGWSLSIFLHTQSQYISKGFAIYKAETLIQLKNNIEFEFSLWQWQLCTSLFRFKRLMRKEPKPMPYASWLSRCKLILFFRFIGGLTWRDIKASQYFCPRFHF